MAGFILMSLVSCKTDPMAYSHEKIKKEIMPEVAETVVEAIENDDEEKLKSVFSKRALDATTDWDLGRDYIFDLYDGKHTEIRDYTFTKSQNYEMNNSISQISCICYIEADDKVYRLDWEDILENEADEDSVGVYNLCIWEWEEGYGNEGGVFPGIDYPERFSGSYIEVVIGYLGSDSESALDLPDRYVSDKLLENMSDEEASNIAKALLAINNNNIKKKWCEPADDGSKVNFFIASDIPDVGKCILYYTCDTDVRNEITAVKITMYDGDIPDSSELVTEDYKAEGVDEFVEKLVDGGFDFSIYPETMDDIYDKKNETIPEIEFEGMTLKMIPEIMNPGSPDGEKLGNVQVGDESYNVTKLKSDYGCDVYLINHCVYAESQNVDGLADYYMNKADITFKYHDFEKSGTEEYNIDFSMEMFQRLRAYDDGNHEMESYKLDKPPVGFEIQADSADGVYNGHISLMEFDGNMVLGSEAVPYVPCKGYFLSEEDAEYVREHIKK